MVNMSFSFFLFSLEKVMRLDLIVFVNSHSPICAKSIDSV